METPIYKNGIVLGILGGAALAFLYIKTIGKANNFNLTKSLIVGAGLGGGIGFLYSKMTEIPKVTPMVMTPTKTTPTPKVTPEPTGNLSESDTQNGAFYPSNATENSDNIPADSTVYTDAQVQEAEQYADQLIKEGN